jgi:hypothetical protein
MKQRLDDQVKESDVINRFKFFPVKEVYRPPTDPFHALYEKK